MIKKKYNFLSDQWFRLGRIPQENGQIKAPAGQSRCVIYTLPRSETYLSFTSDISSKPIILTIFCLFWETLKFYLYISLAHICLDWMLPTPDWTLLESGCTASRIKQEVSCIWLDSNPILLDFSLRSLAGNHTCFGDACIFIGRRLQTWCANVEGGDWFIHRSGEEPVNLGLTTL